MNTLTDATAAALARLFRVYVPGSLQASVFADAKGLAPLARANLIHRGDTQINRIGLGQTRTHITVLQTDDGKRIIGGIIALLAQTSLDTSI